MNPPTQDAFVPLTKATAVSQDRSDLSVTVVRDTQAAPAFLPLSAPPKPAALGAAPTPRAHEPQITLQKEGDRVTGIQIICTCGEVIELGCVYAAPPAKI